MTESTDIPLDKILDALRHLDLITVEFKHTDLFLKVLDWIDRMSKLKPTHLLLLEKMGAYHELFGGILYRLHVLFTNARSFRKGGIRLIVLPFMTFVIRIGFVDEYRLPLFEGLLRVDVHWIWFLDFPHPSICRGSLLDLYISLTAIVLNLMLVESLLGRKLENDRHFGFFIHFRLLLYLKPCLLYAVPFRHYLTHWLNW